MLRMLGDIDGNAQFFGKNAAESRTYGQASGKGTFSLHGDTGGQTAHASSYGNKNSGGDILRGCTAGQQSDNLRFRKDGAHAGYGGRFSRHGQSVESVKIPVENTGKNLKKTARACGALVIHQKIQNSSVRIGTDDLAVLPAYVQYQTSGGERRTAPAA